MIERYAMADKLGLEIVNADIMGCLVTDIMKNARTWLDLGSGRGEFSLALLGRNNMLNIWNLDKRPDYIEVTDNARKLLPLQESTRIYNVAGKIELITRGRYASEGILRNSMDVVSVHCYEPGKMKERDVINAMDYVLKPEGHSIITLDSELDNYEKFLKHLNARFSRVIIGDHPVVYPQTSYTFALWHRCHNAPPFIWVRR